MYSVPNGWKLLMDKLVGVLGGYAGQQIAAGPEVIQIFDSWIGAPQSKGLRDLRTRTCGVPGETPKGPGSAGDLFWRGYSQPSVDGHRYGCGRHRDGLARSSLLELE
jgi:hypothetical protein